MTYKQVIDSLQSHFKISQVLLEENKTMILLGKLKHRA